MPAAAAFVGAHFLFLVGDISNWLFLRFSRLSDYLKGVIATPMIGGVITSVLLELLVYPVIFLTWKKRGLKQSF